MISLENDRFYTFTKMPQNVGDLGKLNFATCFKKLPKVQKIVQSGHTVHKLLLVINGWGKSAYSAQTLYTLWTTY